MAAYEKFAGAQITGGAEATSMAYKARGGGIPIGEIPNVPRVDLSMPLAKYPGIPAIRYEEMHVGGQDWGRRAAQLQQDELPGSFSRASQRIAAAAGQGQEYMAKSIGQGMKALSQGIENFASGFAQFGERLQNETRDSANAKEDNSFDIHWSNFKAQAAKEGIPPSQWGDRFWNGPEGKAYQQEVGALKGSGGPLGSVGLSDHLDSKVAGRQAFVHVNAMNNEAEQAHASNVTAHKFRYESALSENRFDDARQAAVEAKNANIITDGEFEARMDPKHGEIKRAEDKWYADTVISGPRPDIAKSEAKKILDATDQELAKAPKQGKGAISALFPSMDKVEARRVYDLAERAVAEKEKTDTANLIENASQGNWNEEQIRKTAKEKNLDPKTTESVVKSVSENRPYDDRKATNAYVKVNLLDFRDPKTALKELRAVQQLILDTTDKRTQEVLLKEVDQKWNKRDQPTSLQQVESQATTRMIESWYPSTDKEWEEKLKGTPSEFREREKNRLDKERMELHMSAKKFLEDNPEFDPGKLREFIVDKHTPKLQEDSKNAVNPAPNAAVDVRRPYLGAAGTPVVPKPGEGPLSLAPEDIAAREAKAQKSKPTAAQPGFTQTGAGYVIPGTPGENVEPEAVVGAQTPSPTPLTLSAQQGVAPQPTTPSPTPLTRGSSAAPVPTTQATQPGQKLTIQSTAYVPGMGGQEGKNEVASRGGPAYTMEQYERGEVPWVSVAADPNSSLQGKFLKNDAYPGVVFKVEDTGKAFAGAGDTRIDIAFSDKGKAKSFTAAGNDYQVIDEGGAAQIAGGPRGTAPSVTARPTETTGPIKVTNRARELDLPAMKRPRDTSKISKIVVHGDVLTDVDKLIDVQRNDDRGYHYYIGLDGSVTMAVDPGHIANHIKGANSDSIGIILVGADNGRMPTAAQDAAAKKLISQLAKQYHISNKDVYGHGERQPNRRDVREGGNVARDIREHGFV